MTPLSSVWLRKTPFVFYEFLFFPMAPYEYIGLQIAFYGSLCSVALWLIVESFSSLYLPMASYVSLWILIVPYHLWLSLAPNGPIWPLSVLKRSHIEHNPILDTYGLLWLLGTHFISRLTRLSPIFIDCLWLAPIGLDWADKPWLAPITPD